MIDAIGRALPTWILVTSLLANGPIVHAQEADPLPAADEDAGAAKKAADDATEAAAQARDAVAEATKTAEEAEKAADETARQLGAQQAQLDSLLTEGEAQKQELDALSKKLDEEQNRVATRDSILAEQRDQLENLQAAVKKQQDRLAESDSVAAQQQKEFEQLNELVLELTNRLRTLEDTAPMDSLTHLFEERMNRLEESVDAIPEVPPDIVSAGNFPGSFTIPGTGAALKIGGWVRTSWITTLDALGTEDRFICATIPIAGTPEAEKGSRVSLSAKASRLNFDLRTPTGVGQMRAFIEGDFAGGDENGDGEFRLRHAYGQYRRVIAGQTWSNPVDLRANPYDIDFEGLNARIQFRQTQIRWFATVAENVEVRAALENPSPELSGVSGISQFPDLTGVIVWARDPSHVQAALILRQLRGEPGPGETVRALGVGLSISTRVIVSVLDERDGVILNINVGRGIGHYITDLRSEGGQDAVYDSTSNTLEAIPVLTGYVAFHHYWKGNVHSTLLYGLVNVDNLGIQGPDAYHRTQRFSLNLIWTPITRLDIGAEVLYGTRENKGGGRGSARQIQLAGTFRF